MKRSLLDIDLKLLKIFKHIVEHHSLTLAANELNISVSSVSNQLTDLEHRLGLILCRRGRGGFELTDEGRLVYEAHEDLLRDLGGFSSRIGDITQSLVGEVRLSLVSALLDTSSLPLDRAMRAFKSRSKFTTISLGIHAARVIEEQILDESVDIGISVHQRNIPELSQEIIGAEPIAFYCGNEHPLFDVDPTDLTEEIVMQHERCFRDYMRYSDGSRRRRSQLHTAQSNELEGVAMLVLSGLYLGHLPARYAARWETKGLMRQVMPSRFNYENKVVLVTKSNRSQSKVVRAMIEDLRGAVHNTTLDIR